MKNLIISITCLLLVAGCDTEQNAAKKDEIKQCKEAGGIVIRSDWDHGLLKDCIFKREQTHD